MELPIQITFHGMQNSAALEAAIRERAEKLGQFHAGITRCRAVVTEVARHKQQGKEFTVRLEIHVAGGDIAINRDHHEDAHVAVRDAFDAAKRKLEDHARRQRGDVKRKE